MIYADVKIFNKKEYFDIKMNENASGLTIIEQLSRILKLDNGLPFVLNKRTGSLIKKDSTVKEQNIKGGDTLIVIASDTSTGNKD